jgi:arsenite/tail-anchored protein-transporting ATPase
VVFGARKEFVVLDTAPTGHTLHQLDTAGAYHRQVTGGAAPASVRIRTPPQMLQDPSHTRVLIVTHAETTPVLEAEALEDDLERAGIRPYGWVINASLAAAGPRDPVLRQRAAAELPMIRRLLKQPSRRVAIIPYQAAEPVGARALLALAPRDTAPLRRDD